MVFVLPGRLLEPDNRRSLWLSVSFNQSARGLPQLCPYGQVELVLNSKTSNLIRVYAPDRSETCDVKISTHFFPERHRRKGK